MADDNAGYAVKIRHSLLGTYYPTVLHDDGSGRSEVVPPSVLGPPMGCLTHEGAVELGRKIAERHRENSQPPIPLNLSEGA